MQTKLPELPKLLAILAALLPAAPAFADTKFNAWVPGLPNATLPLGTTDYFPVVQQSGTTTKLSAALAAPIGPGFVVSPSGSDSNVGSVASPFLTLGQCQTSMRISTTQKTCYLRSGTYAMTAGLTLDFRDTGTTYTFYPADGVDTPKLTENTAFRFFTIQTGADNVTINGLTATGSEAVSGLGSCTGTESMFIDAWISAGNNLGPNNLTATNNVLNTFDCGILLLENFNPVVSFNEFTNIGYAALVANHATGLANQTIWQGNIFYDLDPNVAPGGPNSYGITFSTTSNGQSANFTVLSNQAYNCHTWTCFNTHGGTNIFFYNNVAVFAGSLSANTSNFSSTAASAPYSITNQLVKGNVADNGSSGSTLNATAYVWCSVSGCASNNQVVSGDISSNISYFGVANGTQIYNSSNVTLAASGANTGGIAPSVVSSVTFVGGGTTSSCTHGIANGSCGTLAVNMSNPGWAFPLFPAPIGNTTISGPGVLTITGTNSGGFVICNNNQLCQSAGGTAAGTYNDFNLVATLHNMSGSPATFATPVTITVN